MNENFENYKGKCVPLDWKDCKIKDVVQFEGGAQPPKSEFKSKYEEGYIRLIQIRDYKSDEYITFIPEKLARKFCDETDVMIGRYGPPIFQILRGIRGAYNVALMKAIPDETKVTKDYIYYYLQIESLFKLIDRLSRRSSGQTGVDIDALNNFGIPLPSIDEQKEIVRIIKLGEELINKQEQLIEKKKEFKKGLMQVLYSQGVKKEARVKTKLGDVPESWKVVKAKEVFNSVSIKNNEDEELLSVTQDRGTIPRSLLEGSVVMPEGSTKGYKLVVPNNFIISLRSFQGGLEISQNRGIISPAYTVLENKIDICHDYFKYYFKKEDFISRLNGVIVGIRDGKQISFSDFGEMYLPLPHLDEQKKIAEILSLSDKEIELLQKELEALKLQKKGLMQRLLTGVVRVKV